MAHERLESEVSILEHLAGEENMCSDLRYASEAHSI